MAKQFLFNPAEPVVRTRAGKLRGFQFDGVYAFHGVRYADAGRFMPPTPVKPWDGVRDADSFGYICPLLSNPLPQKEVMTPHRFWPENEHCQNLNIWTNSLDSAAKKPVMLWIHGGRFSTGSAIEHVAYDGDHMAKYGDVVFVSVNHRLNILGYLDMSSFDAKYENSVNAGIADLIEALKWIRDNIAVFGGDPDNVTIFGQSGGGRKVTSLLQTPAAEGLFHKAIIQSGTSVWDPTSSAHHRKLVCLMLAELELPESEYAKLERVPYPVLAQAYSRARPKLEEQEGVLVDFTPVKNGWFMGAPPFHAFTPYARKVPLMAGSCIAEVGSAPPMPDRDSYTRDMRRELIEKTYGAYTDRLIALFKKAYPDKNELLLLDYDPKYRHNLLRYVERKLNESDKGVPVYLYLFATQFDYEGGKHAWHTSEIPYAFHTAERIPVCHIDGMERLEDEMSGAWINFARTGNPNHPGLPEVWPEYTLSKRPVMIFDRKSGVRCDHEKELVELFKTASTPPDTTRNPSRAAPLADERWMY